jgi:prepilin-type N-terminal cleavage/methylation domain-containing protein
MSAPLPWRGFTLVEVMVALALTTLGVSVAAALLRAGLGATHELVAEQRELDRDANRVRWLRLTFASVDADKAAGGLRGGVDQVSFTSWQRQAEGWCLPRRISLRVREGRLEAEVVGESSVALADSVTSLDLDYLPALGAATRWVREWNSSLGAPLAMRIRLGKGNGATDTLLFAIGPRG